MAQNSDGISRELRDRIFGAYVTKNDKGDFVEYNLDVTGEDDHQGSGAWSLRPLKINYFASKWCGKYSPEFSRSKKERFLETFESKLPKDYIGVLAYKYDFDSEDWSADETEDLYYLTIDNKIEKVSKSTHYP